MYSVLLSDYEKRIKLVDRDLRKVIKTNYKVVIIAWTFPTEIDYDTY